jgi:hypothetical protein
MYFVLLAFVLTAILFAGGRSQFVRAFSDPAFGQGADPAQVAANFKANAQALKSFTHQQRMQLQLKGDTKKVTLSQITYDMNGNQQKTLISEQPSPADAQPSGGRLKQRIVAKKTDEFKQMMEDIRTLVMSYTELPPDQLKAAVQKGSVKLGQGDMNGAIEIDMTGVIQPGDSLTFWIDRTALLFRRVAIATTYEGNPVTATANYSMLQSGQVYMSQAILNYPAKQVVVEIDNLNYQRGQ